jgi:GNAT superfamily N-acetyltransferase
VLDAIFWEVADDDPLVDPRFQKEEWFSSTLLEWGPCGKMALGDDGEPVGFSEFAPPSLFPRLGRFRCGRVSADAVYLAYCYVTPGHRGRRVGSDLIRSVARDLIDRGYRALEALGERGWSSGWILPADFLAANRFTIVRDDPEIPLFRLDLREASMPMEHETAAAASRPWSG